MEIFSEKSNLISGTKTKVSVSGVQRYESLDCLRGIGALFVLFFHTALFGDALYLQFNWLPTRIVYSGHQALTLFFILSGFSLHMMLRSLKNSLFVFMVSRTLRLYPTYLFSILVSIVAYWTLDHNGFVALDNQGIVPSLKPNFHKFLDHLFMIGWFNTASYNPPIWSIVVEMRLSILFPLLFLLANNYGLKSLMAGSLLSILIGIFFWDYFPPMEDSAFFTSIQTLHSIVFFIAGSLLAKHRDKIIKFIQSQTKYFRRILLALSLFIYTYAFDYDWSLGQMCLADIMVGIGASGIIMMSISYPILARSNILRALGKISFSLYLLHFPCFIVLQAIFHDTLPLPTLRIIIVLASLVSAYFTWLLIERRSLEWSRAMRVRR